MAKQRKLSTRLYDWLRRQDWLYDVEHDSLRGEYRRLVHFAMRPVGRISAARYKVSRLLNNHQQPIRLNLGSGRQPLPGWVNIDINPFSQAQLLLDIRDPWPFKEGDVETIYMRHFLEHFTEAEVLAILAKCHRVLRTGGGLRIGVPSLEFAIGQYQKSDFSRSSWVSAYGRKSAGRQFFSYIMDNGNHKIILDYGYLAELLEISRFKNVRRLCGGKTELFNSDLLAPKDELGDIATLYVECVK
ncbi:MAG: methyltransferase domain-containing protein [Acidobacteria bacterium]|nr:methyltransferase domain-containing protein [Acidobacteriota bacterium]